MIFPKIKWSTAKDEWWYTITAEISIGSARYMESRCVSKQEVEHSYYGSAMLAWIIERMQNNILDVLGAEATQRSSRVSHVKATNHLEGVSTTSLTSSKMADYESGVLSSDELVAEVRAFYGIIG